jgi:hypothetical protein
LGRKATVPLVAGGCVAKKEMKNLDEFACLPVGDIKVFYFAAESSTVASQ